jgi:MFS family permease
MTLNVVYIISRKWIYLRAPFLYKKVPLKACAPPLLTLTCFLRPCLKVCKFISFLMMNWPFISISSQYDLVCDKSILLSIAQSSSWVGMWIGLVIGGYLSDKYGRKRTVGSGYAMNSIVAFILVFPKSYIVFTVCRLIFGFGSGSIYIVDYLKCLYDMKFWPMAI